ncbi:MAG: hypothetical protein ACPLZA_06980 [Thermodesulfovibrio sp.]
MLFSIEIIEELEKLEPAIRSSLIKILKSLDKTIGEMVKREDFLELKVDFKKLTKIVEELAEAQKRTEQRVEELAEAQKRTEEELRRLASDHRETRKILGNLTDTVGYGLEDRIFPFIKKFAETEYGIKVKDFGRKNIVYPDGNYDELNIYVEGERDGQRVYLIGECKAQLGKKDIEKFIKIIERVRQYLRSDVNGFIVSYSIQPKVEEYLRKSHPEINFYYSYYFDMKYKYGE